MGTYIRCDSTVSEMAGELIKTYHPELSEFKVTLDYLFAHADLDEHEQPKGPALKHGGYPAYGIARIIGLKDRVAGRCDGEIVLDGDKWPVWPEERQKAVLDHELHHFIVKKTRSGAVHIDDHGRPKLVMRKHDYDFGWFTAIAARHGAASIERLQAKVLFDSSGQLFWPALCDKDESKKQGSLDTFVEGLAKAAGEGGSVTITTGETSATIKGK